VYTSGMNMYDRFFASPALRGAASTIDFFGALPSVADQILERSDAEALAADWRLVGLDLYRAMRSFDPFNPDQGALHGRK